MAFCPACRGRVAIQDKFCRHCGSVLATASVVDGKVQPINRAVPPLQRSRAGHWENCPECRGLAKVRCPRCTGEGTILGAWSGRDPCPVCKGKTTIRCPNLECQQGRVWIKD
jgi:hypothetical protein